MLSRLLADSIVLIHLLFILFVVFGALLLLWRRRLIWLHLPAVLWGVGVELFGGVCPLTPLEVRLREGAAQQGYEGGFVEHYLLPAIYPDELPRSVQIGLGLGVLIVNLAVYAWILRRRRSGRG